MACPYFYPLAPRGHGALSGPQDAMLPLGDSWTGICRALPGAVPPDEAGLRPLCNLGYARGNCAQFPAGDGPDAVRFAVSRDNGATVSIQYVVERDHHPFAHGRLDYSVATGAVAPPPPSEVVARQAQAYAESYRRRKAATT
jgi:hypothetical protein